MKEISYILPLGVNGDLRSMCVGVRTVCLDVEGGWLGRATYKCVTCIITVILISISLYEHEMLQISQCTWSIDQLAPILFAFYALQAPTKDTHFVYFCWRAGDIR